MFCRSTLYILDIRPLSDVYIVHFSQPMACLFNFLKLCLLNRIVLNFDYCQLIFSIMVFVYEETIAYFKVINIYISSYVFF